MNKSKFSSNTLIILVIVLLVGNIYFATQYVGSIKKERQAKSAVTSASDTESKTVEFLKLYVSTVLGSNSISSDDRIKLESGVAQLQDPAISAEWKTLSGSKDANTTQASALKLLAMLVGKLK